MQFRSYSSKIYSCLTTPEAINFCVLLLIRKFAIIQITLISYFSWEIQKYDIFLVTYILAVNCIQFGNELTFDLEIVFSRLESPSFKLLGIMTVISAGVLLTGEMICDILPEY